MANSVCASPPYQWNLTNPGNNVQIFAQLIDDIYKKCPQPIDKLSFNYTFVKYASEVANFRVIDNNEERRPTFKARSGVNYAADEFAIPKTVVDQIMQLTFSFAARILLCLTSAIYYSSNGIGEWQMQTLLSAYKMLAARTGNNEDGIFPFPIVQIGANGAVIKWPGRFTFNSFSKNFNFVLKLSEFSLSHYDVYKVLEAILIESNAASAIITNERPPAVHTFLKQYFISKLYRKSNKLKQYIRLKFGSNMTKVDCAFVHFGREMERRLEENSFISYPNFSEYVERMEEEECDEVPHNQNAQNTPPDLGSKQLTMKLFHEPLWNYARAIQIDSHECKAVLQFADALSKIINFELNSDKKNEYSMDDHIMEEYSCTNNSCPLLGHFGLSKCRETIPKFGQILFETFYKYLDDVKYDEKRQLLSFPSARSEYFLRRLFDFVQRLKSTTLSNIGDDLDFVKTIQNIASMANIDHGPSSINSTGFFGFKIKNINKMVELNLPTWKLPYFIYLENKKELEQENALKNFKFIHSLSEYSLTIYEIIQMANILGEINKVMLQTVAYSFLINSKMKAAEQKSTKAISVHELFRSK
uniref:Uncharacterized protein n=1 Tax=Globodera rostochiensis TaxID=31243 RepID=A0A914I0X1_GLORO